jgi:hypothetical protein
VVAFFKGVLLQQPYKARQIAWNTKHVQKNYRILIGTSQLNSHLENTNLDGKNIYCNLFRLDIK